MKVWHHGGEIYEGAPVRLDFSVNLNPLGLPASIRDGLPDWKESVLRYPDTECRALRAAISEKYGIPAEHIFCGNGASEVFASIVQAVRPKRAFVEAPTFSGYEHALSVTGTEVLLYHLKKEDGYAVTEDIFRILEEDPDMVFLCNPNNPIGNTIRPDLLIRFAEACREKGIYLVADECFLGFTEDEEARTLRGKIKENPYLIVVSAFTKLYAMPGLRLGYAFSANEELLGKMKAVQTEWSVSGPAQEAGQLVLSETAYVEEAKALLRKERAYLTEALTDLGYQVCPGEANYLFFHGAPHLSERLRKKGILIRNCANYHDLSEGDYRIAVKKHRDNEVLIETIREENSL